MHLKILQIKFRIVLKFLIIQEKTENEIEKNEVHTKLRQINFIINFFRKVHKYFEEYVNN